MMKSGNGVDFCDQEIIIGRAAIYASGNSLRCGEIERVTEKNVVMKDGAMARKDKVFVMDKKWKIKQ